MKINKLIRASLLAIAGIALFTTTAPAQVAVTYNLGELFIGFRATDGVGFDQDYLINIGPAATYIGAAPGSVFNLNIGNILLDLNIVFGVIPDWKTRADVRWGVYGTTHNALDNTTGEPIPGLDPAWTLYAGKAAINLVQQPAHTRSGIISQSLAAGAIETLAEWYEIAYTSTVNSNVGVIQSTATVEPYLGDFSGGAAFGRFMGSEGDFGNGTAGTALDLFRITPGPAGGASGTPGEFIGRFTINDSATITFTAVPEPHTFLLFLVGAGVVALVVLARPTTKFAPFPEGQPPA